ncbi:MAG: mandelate racemase [Deltaproteobacteria bacterium]|nr:mandelate racemase [Deltaproteobacteria bacterium]
MATFSSMVPSTLVVVKTFSAGTEGLGYTFADAATAGLVSEVLAGQIRGLSPLDVPLVWNRMVRSVRNLGRSGIASMAIAAVDMSVWDLKAKLLGVSVLDLLGAARHRIAAYGSGGFTSYPIDRLQEQLGAWAASGLSAVKMKIGREPDKDLERVRAARAAIGARAELFVDANGAYERKQALRMALAFEAHGVTWFEEPVSSDDLEGLRFVRERAPMRITAGEYGYDSRYFKTMLAAGAVDVLQVDGTRCAGVTGFLAAATLCDAFSTPLSAHTAPTLHAYLCCAAKPACNVEFFFDHARIEQLCFDGALRPRQGFLVPNRSKPGFGLVFREAEARTLARRSAA